MGLCFIFLVKQTTNCRAADVKRLPEQWDVFKRRFQCLQGQIRRSSLTVELEVSQGPNLVTLQSQIDHRLTPLYLPNFIHDFHHRMDVRELTDGNWQRIDIGNWGVDEFQSVKCTQKAQIMGSFTWQYKRSRNIQCLHNIQSEVLMTSSIIWWQ